MASTTFANNLQAPPVGGALPFPHRPAGRQPPSPERDRCRLQGKLDSIFAGVTNPTTEETVRHVFDSLSRLLEILRIVELNVGEGGPSRVTLAAFALAESETVSLAGLIETRTSRAKCLKGPLREALDGMSFALRHELKGVFGRVLAGITAERAPGEVRTDFMKAHGLLSNCFQQSVIALVRVFDPTVRGELLFEDYRARYRQSTALLRELSALVRLARRAQESPDAEASSLLARELGAFCKGSINYLMYKDLDEFADLSRQVVCSRGSAKHGFILHCFTTYLEALINQVRLRSVLNDKAPAPAQVKPLAKPLAKPLKRVRKGRR